MRDDEMRNDEAPDDEVRDDEVRDDEAPDDRTAEAVGRDEHQADSQQVSERHPADAEAADQAADVSPGSWAGPASPESSDVALSGTGAADPADEVDEAGEESQAAQMNQEDLVDSPRLPTLDDVVAGIDASLAAEPAEPSQAVEAAQQPEAQELRRHIVFTLAGTHYATPMGSVVEIGHVPPVTDVPNVPEWVLGVTNLRGEILAVVDFRRFLDLDPESTEGAGRMLVTRAAGEELTAGLVVDDVKGVANLAGDLAAPTAPFEDRIAPFVAGVQAREDRMLAVLDLEALLASDDFRQFA